MTLASVLAATGARAQTQPVARYESNLLEGRTGDVFEVMVSVQWAGRADAFDVPAPRPSGPPGLAFQMLGSESRHDGGVTHLRFRWRVAAEEADAFSIPELLPVVAYPADRGVPLTVRAEQPLRVRIDRPRGRMARAGWVVGAGAAVVLAAVLGTRVQRRRAVHRAGAKAAAEAAALGAARHERFAEALRHRMAGAYPAYLHAMLELAGELEADPGALAELAALHERVAFASYQPGEHELERAAALVRRRLTAHHPEEADRS